MNYSVPLILKKARKMQIQITEEYDFKTQCKTRRIWLIITNDNQTILLKQTLL